MLVVVTGIGSFIASLMARARGLAVATFFLGLVAVADALVTVVGIGFSRSPWLS